MNLLWMLFIFLGHQKCNFQGFPGSPVVKNSPSNARDTGSILGRGDPTF